MSQLSALWLAPTYPSPADSFGGIFTRTQAQALSRLGVEITVVAPAPWSPWPLGHLHPRWRRYAAAPRVQDDGRVRVLRPRWLAAPGNPSWLAIERQMETLARREVRTDRAARFPIDAGRPDLEPSVAMPSIVHGHFAWPHGLAAVHLGQGWRRPVVVTLHGSDVNLQPQARPGGLGRLRTVVEGAGAVLAVSEALAERTATLTGRRPTVLPVGIDLRPLQAARRPIDEARAGLGWPQDRRIVTFVGRLIEVKGLRELAAAAERLPPDVLFMIIGDGPLRAELAASEAARMGRMRLLGRVEHDRVPEHLAASTVVTLPSHAEGLPTILVEAGAMGVPVVATAVGGVPQLLGEAGGWLTPPHDPTALAAAIRAALDDPVEAARRAAALEQTVVEEHDADRQAARLLAVYRSLVT